MTAILNLAKQPPFGRLTVLRMDEARLNGCVAWVCRCRCGTVKSFTSNALRSGSAKSASWFSFRSSSFVILTLSVP